MNLGMVFSYGCGCASRTIVALGEFAAPIIRPPAARSVKLTIRLAPIFIGSTPAA